MSQVAIFAEIVPKPDSFDALYAVMAEHAAASREEPGCLRFDMAVPKKGEPRLMLYEVYADAAAFDTHANSERMQGVLGRIGDLVADTKLTICELKDGGP